jgi:hypothetical protein
VSKDDDEKITPAERTRRWNKAHPERRAENKRRYHETHREQEAEYHRRYTEANSEKEKERKRLWRLANPDYNRNYQQRRRARMRGVDFERFNDQEIFDRDGWTCGICTEPIDPSLRFPDAMSVSLDHIKPIARGGESE